MTLFADSYRKAKSPSAGKSAKSMASKYRKDSKSGASPARSKAEEKKLPPRPTTGPFSLSAIEQTKQKPFEVPFAAPTARSASATTKPKSSLSKLADLIKAATGRTNKIQQATNFLTQPLPVALAQSKIGQNLIKDIGQGTARTVASVALTAMNPYLKAKGQQPIKELEEARPGFPRKVQQAFFGKEKVQDIPTRVAGAKKYLESKGVSPKYSQELGFLGVAGVTAADLAGGGKSKVVKELAATKDMAFIARALKGLKIAEKDIDILAPLIREAKTVDEVTSILKKTRELKPGVIAQELEPLAETEALKVARKGTGQFQPGELYSQTTAGGERTILISGKDAQGNLTGWYLPSNQSAKLLGQKGAYLEPAKFTRPASELKPLVADEATVKTAINKLFFGEKSAGALPTSLDPLTTEARKYKSAEEFVKAQKPLVHHTKESFDLKQFDIEKTRGDEYGPGLNLSYKGVDPATYGNVRMEFYPKFRNPLHLDKVVPIDFAKKIKRITGIDIVDNEGKIAVEKIGDWVAQKTKSSGYKGYKKLWNDTLQKAGIDATIMPVKGGSDQVVVSLDPKNNLLTKSQLTDIYNQATKGETVAKTTKKLSELETPRLQTQPSVKEGLPGGVPKTVETKVSSLPSSVPPDSDPVKTIVEALKKAKPLEKQQAKLYSAERGRRVAGVVAAGKVPGEKGYFTQLSKLKGELPKVQFESIRKEITQPNIDSLFDMVEKANVTPFEKITAKGGLAKLLGAEGGAVPTRGELELLGEIFPDDFMKAVLEKRPFIQKLWSGVENALNLPRAVMATADLSAPLRQGIFLVGRPKQWLPAFKDMFKYAFSENAYKGLMDSIKTRPSYLAMRESNLALTDMGSTLAKREESFMSNLIEKIPGFGAISKGSNRAYSGFLNKLRADVFDDLLKNAKQLGIDRERPQVVDDIAKFVNSATGRGDLGMFNRAAPILNGIFFSPRLLASRLNLLNPLYYAKLDPFVRKEALKSLLTFGGTAMTVLGLAKLAGADVETDPRSADFAKAKFGNTRYDVLGGFQQYIRLASQLATGKIISSTTGREITLGEGYKPLTRKDVLMRFFENKESPVASFATALMTGKTGTGEDLDIPTEVVNRSIPLVIQDMYDLYKERGLAGLGMAAPGIFGVGSQTYGGQELVKGKDVFGKETLQVQPKKGIGEIVSEKLFGKKPLEKSKSYNVEAYYKELIGMPKEEAAAKFEEIAKTNPTLAKQIAEVVKERKLGITVEDKALKAMGVENGDRAFEIAKNLKELDTKEEKAKLWEEYVKKGIITDAVKKQLILLLREE